ncbi:MAG: hypothetical protein AB7R89_33320 [Dehalococcoidia bacterium]
MPRRRPSITRGPADHFASPGERIAEITFSNGAGCLISLRDNDGKPVISLYRLDKGITVHVADSGRH